MKIIPNPIIDSLVFEIDRYEDSRGYFQEVFHQNKYPFDGEWKQANISKSHKNVLRGVHVASYSKLCTCIQGAMFDVIVDLRRGSPTYLEQFGVWLTESNKTQLYIPANCGHGFVATEDNTTLMYLQGGCWTPEEDKVVRWDSLGIDWPKIDGDYILSHKDASAVAWAE